jgi:hypothetical protein
LLLQRADSPRGPKSYFVLVERSEVEHGEERRSAGVQSGIHLSKVVNLDPRDLLICPTNRSVSNDVSGAGGGAVCVLGAVAAIHTRLSKKAL